MGMCKECGGVFSSTEMENGVCKSCRENTTHEGSTKKIEIDHHILHYARALTLQCLCTFKFLLEAGRSPE